MYKAIEIARFVKQCLQPKLPIAYQLYGKRDLVRMRGNFAQLVLIAQERGHYLRVLPTLYVVGADLSDETTHQTVSLYVRNPHDWNLNPEILNSAFATQIVQQLERSPVTAFVSEFGDNEIDKSMRWFSKAGTHWAADLFLAFFNMTRGAPTARKDLAQAFELFRRNSRMVTDKPLRDWEEALLARFHELEARLDRPDCIGLCRADAERHSKLLKLPPIAWPPEWPESVPPWPKEPDSLFARFGGLFTR
jgi:hypothetical protein